MDPKFWGGVFLGGAALVGYALAIDWGIRKFINWWSRQI